MDGLSAFMCFAGVLLFLLGLLTGFGIPVFRSPRIGLSAHLAAIESGIGMIAIGLLLPHLVLAPFWGMVIVYGLAGSLYLLWVGLLAGAGFGTGRALPIAGAGFEAKPWQEGLARGLVGLGSLGGAGAVAVLLVMWQWAG